MHDDPDLSKEVDQQDTEDETVASEQHIPEDYIPELPEEDNQEEAALIELNERENIITSISSLTPYLFMSGHYVL